MRAGKHSWLWEAAQATSASAGEWEAGQLGMLYHLPPQPCSLGFFMICVFPHLRSLSIFPH